MTTSPTVGGLCITRNRRQFLPAAIRCFLSQTYEPKKLLILADGEDVSDLAPQDPRIRLIALPENERPHTIGAKRNLGCSILTTEVIAHFDDDDLSESGRLADQVSRLQQTGLAVTGYNKLKFRRESDGAWFEYSGTSQWVFGTSLVFRRDWWLRHKFPEEQIGEDNGFVNTAAMAHQLAVSSTALMSAGIHNGNTSPKIVAGRAWVPVAEPEAYAAAATEAADLIASTGAKGTK